MVKTLKESQCNLQSPQDATKIPTRNTHCGAGAPVSEGVLRTPRSSGFITPVPQRHEEGKKEGLFQAWRTGPLWHTVCLLLSSWRTCLMNCAGAAPNGAFRWAGFSALHFNYASWCFLIAFLSLYLTVPSVAPKYQAVTSKLNYSKTG